MTSLLSWWRDYYQQKDDERSIDWQDRMSIARVRWAYAIADLDLYEDNYEVSP